MFDSAEVQLECLLGWAGRFSPASALGAALADDDR